MKWQFTCSCGDKFEVMGDTKEMAAENAMKMMAPMMQKHMEEKHIGMPMPTMEQAQTNVMANLRQLN